MKKTFDSIAFMRKRREELSRDFAGLSWQQIEMKIQKALKNNPLWKKGTKQKSSSLPAKRTKHI